MEKSDEGKGFDEEDDVKSNKRSEDEKPTRGRSRRMRNEEPAEESTDKAEQPRSDKEESSEPVQSGKGRRRRPGEDEETVAPAKSGGGWMDATTPKPVQNDIEDFGTSQDSPT